MINRAGKKVNWEIRIEETVFKEALIISGLLILIAKCLLNLRIQQYIPF